MITIDYPDFELQNAARRVANVYVRIVNRRLGCTIPLPLPLKFDLEFQDAKSAHSAGRAHSTMVVELNMTLFRENPEYFLNHTIPHEIAHLVQFNKFDLKGVHTLGHGVHWKETMRIMGKVPHEHHKLDTTNAVLAYKKHKAQKAADKKAASKKFLKGD